MFVVFIIIFSINTSVTYSPLSFLLGKGNNSRGLEILRLIDCRKVGVFKVLDVGDPRRVGGRGDREPKECLSILLVVRM